MEQKPISNAPMVLGIIGGVIGMPAALCSGMCAAGITAVADNTTAEQASQVGNSIMWINLIGALLGFIAAFMYKKKPGLWGGLMLAAGLLLCVNLFWFNMMGVVPGVLFIIGGAIALSQRSRVAA